MTRNNSNISPIEANARTSINTTNEPFIIDRRMRITLLSSQPRRRFPAVVVRAAKQDMMWHSWDHSDPNYPNSPHHELTFSNLYLKQMNNFCTIVLQGSISRSAGGETRILGAPIPLFSARCCAIWIRSSSLVCSNCSIIVYKYQNYLCNSCILDALASVSPKSQPAQEELAYVLSYVAVISVHSNDFVPT